MSDSRGKHASSQKSRPSKLTGSFADAEKHRRRQAHHKSYQKFRREAERRSLLTKDHESRVKIWEAKRKQSLARIQAIDDEKGKLEELLATMKKAQREYEKKHGAGIEKTKGDGKTRGAYEAYFELETNELVLK